jgi:hypothetical protein
MYCIGYNNAILKIKLLRAYTFFTLYTLNHVDIYSLHIGVIVIRDIMEEFVPATVVVLEANVARHLDSRTENEDR